MTNSYNIVIIDDDPTFNFLNEKVIRACNIAKEIYVFSSGKEALQFFQNSAEEIDLILLDIRMPIMDGFEFLDKYLALGLKNVFVHMLTSSLDDRDKLRASKYDIIKGFHSKPLTKQMLLDLIEMH